MTKQTEAAHRKGHQAGLEGAPKSACPYEDHRSAQNNHVTFARSFRRAWLEGWQEGVDARKLGERRAK